MSGQFHDKGLIGDPDLLNICYCSVGALVDVEQVLERARRKTQGAEYNGCPLFS